MNNVLLRVQYIQSFIVRVLPEQSTYRLRVALRTLLFMFIGWATATYFITFVALFIKTISPTVCIFVEYLRS